jgi:hypothetical protein
VIVDGSTEVPPDYAVSTEERVIGSVTHNAAEFAHTRSGSAQFPKGLTR